MSRCVLRIFPCLRYVELVIEANYLMTDLLGAVVVFWVFPTLFMMYSRTMCKSVALQSSILEKVSLAYFTTMISPFHRYPSVHFDPHIISSVSFFGMGRELMDEVG